MGDMSSDVGPVVETDKPIYQPLHPFIRPQLSKEYINFHDTVLQHIPPTETLPFSRSHSSPFANTGLLSTPVGRTEDRDISPYQIRIFYPPSHEAAKSTRHDGNPKAWPALLWFHGGGYVNGGLASENTFLQFLCAQLSIIVITVNYRHAPEHPYPAAIDDCIASLQHLSSTLVDELGLDRARVAIGGLSAGGQLAASTALWAAQQRDGDKDGRVIRPCFQMLICPVLDNTADISTRWKDSQFAPWLTPGRMGWYRDQYLLPHNIEAGDARGWLASPVFASPELLAEVPSTFVAVAGCDLLAPEAKEFVAKLKREGVEVEEKVYEGATHSVLVLAGVHEQGKIVARDAYLALGKALGMNVGGVELEKTLRTLAVKDVKDP